MKISLEVSSLLMWPSLIVGQQANRYLDDLHKALAEAYFLRNNQREGTGLGLSLAYDIITKGHGGELKVKTNEGEGAEFTILLPIR